ncbi:diguanylate cyclase [Acidisoma cellulosilytica]|uniref:diguanylate cyclase n=1 Tax=Acidisoma cellulosilyticum TaxID=2802395 RepID=A0A963Z4R7_9PROT|nr:diguanylate cyclase [Acidisoma cellulosilyticum]MCB8881892.1 diguanylate cyclase [Acidisoma cellulosilyticum]
MNKRPVILIVDDEVSNIEILSAALEDDYDISFATSADEVYELLRNVMPDLVLLDVLMPGTNGYEVCKHIKSDSLLADIPIIFTTALGHEGAELEGLALGAIDYIAKPISPAIVQARVRNHLELKRMRDQLATLAVTDALTGLGNRRQLEQSLARETRRLSVTGGLLSVIILDIDFFKRFNDLYGHMVGDRCIVQVAATLHRAARRAADVTVRYGGEEFACILPDIGHEEAMEIAETISMRVSALGIPHDASDTAAFVTVSLGVATAPCTLDIPPEAWINAADRQLYLAKNAGRNRVIGRAFTHAELREHIIAAH